MENITNKLAVDISEIMCYTYLVNGNNGSDAVQRQPLLHG